jgi:ferritin-like metal-binding protein YciE
MLKRHCWFSSVHEVVRISCNEALAGRFFFAAFPPKDRDPDTSKQAGSGLPGWEMAQSLQDLERCGLAFARLGVAQRGATPVLIENEKGADQAMPADNTGRKQLIDCLEDVYALEAHLVEVLEDHAKDAQDVPQLRQKIEQHRRETELHRDRLEQRLNALGASKPGMKGGVSGLMGQLLGAISGARTHDLTKNARDDYASEHLEIASYSKLVTIAQAVGDQETVRAAELNLRDEVDMEQWLIQHIPEVTLMELQRDGVQVSQNVLPAVQNTFTNLGIGAFGAQPPPQFGAQPPYQTQPPPGVV